MDFINLSIWQIGLALKAPNFCVTAGATGTCGPKLTNMWALKVPNLKGLTKYVHGQTCRDEACFVSEKEIHKLMIFNFNYTAEFATSETSHLYSPTSADGARGVVVCGMYLNVVDVPSP